MRSVAAWMLGLVVASTSVVATAATPVQSRLMTIDGPLLVNRNLHANLNTGTGKEAVVYAEASAPDTDLVCYLLANGVDGSDKAWHVVASDEGGNNNSLCYLTYTPKAHERLRVWVLNAGRKDFNLHLTVDQ